MNIRKRTWKWKGERHTAWRVDWTDPTERRRQKQFKTKQEAEFFRDKVIRERYAKEYGVLLKASFEEFLKIYETKKPWRTESYRERVMRALKLVPFEEFPTTEAIEAYRDSRLKGGIKPSTVRQDLAAIHDCLKWAVKLRYLGENPTKEVERPSLPVKQDDPAAFIPFEEFEKLLKVSGRDKPIFQFAVWTGLRITEVISLKWEDVNLRDGYVLVKRGKGRKQRIVPILKNARLALKEVPRATFAPEKVFWWATSRHALLDRLQWRCKWAGIPRYTFHRLRHTFGSYAAMSGVDLEVIARCMGHTSPTVTKLYAHLHPDYQRKQLEKMEGFGTRVVQSRRKVRERTGS
jgi:integrase/recombinase XerD